MAKAPADLADAVISMFRRGERDAKGRASRDAHGLTTRSAEEQLHRPIARGRSENGPDGVQFFRERAIPLAQVIAPNHFERKPQCHEHAAQ